LTKGIARVELDRKAMGLRSARLLRLHTAIVNKLHCGDYVAVSHQPGLVIASVRGTVLIRVATLHEFARDNRHKASDNSQARLRYDPVISISSSKSCTIVL
jgi:hypothetical protein